VIQQYPEAVDVALHGGRSAGQDFRRQIQRRARHVSGTVVQLAARAEVHEHDASIFRAGDVLRLDVAVKQARCVDGGYRATQLDSDPDHIAGSKRRSQFDLLLESLTADQLRRQADPIANLFGAVDGDDVRMTDLGEKAPFPDDRASAIRVGGRRGRHELQGHLAIEARIPCAEHFTEGAPADSLEQAKGSPLIRHAFGRRSSRSGTLCRQDVPIYLRYRRDDTKILQK
jgi:hypothetical protein